MNCSRLWSGGKCIFHHKWLWLGYRNCGGGHWWLTIFVTSVFYFLKILKHNILYYRVAPSAARYVHSGQIKSARLAAALGQNFRGRPWHRPAQIILRSDRTDRLGTLTSRHCVQHTTSTAYTVYSIQWLLHTARTASSHNRLSPAPSQSLISQLTMYDSTF